MSDPALVHRLWFVDFSEFSEEDLWDHYQKCLRAHDWGFEQSTDEDVNTVGRHERLILETIKTKCKEYDDEQAQRLFDAYLEPLSF